MNMSPGTDDLFTDLYGELRAIARREHARAGAPRTLQPTALINEAYVKLQQKRAWENRAQFLGTASTAMRHILIDAARARCAAKRDAHDEFTRCIDAEAANGIDDREVIRVGDALATLAAKDSNLAKVVECRFFAGFSEAETAEVLGVSNRTVSRWWLQARAWIHRELETG
jgi:RNA polymerase sigma factor (TIGR02999 family)